MAEANQPPLVSMEDVREKFHYVDDGVWEKFGRYFELLVSWNEHMNLTAITEQVEVYVKHFYDSLLMLEHATAESIYQEAQSIVDVGTGAGFPGLVLAIRSPDKQFTLVDALAKRLKFLETVKLELGLKNVELVHGRAEDLGQQKRFRESYDIAVSRAVAKLGVLVELTLPLVKVGGWFVSYKGPSIEEELSEAQNAIRLVGAKQAFSLTEPLPYEMGWRTLVGIVKEKETAKKYPRKAGTPQKNPL
jgi:16S rRNA (guanine527-N7)-methyltransferase